MAAGLEGVNGNYEGVIGHHPAYVGGMITLCVIAVVLNLLVIVAVVRCVRTWASVDIFIINLAACDIVHAAIVNPVQLENMASFHKDFYGNKLLCKVIMFIPLACIMASILTIVAIAVDRYRAIVLYKRLCQRNAVIISVGIWIGSLVGSAPQLYEYNIYLVEDDMNPNYTYASCGSEDIITHFETVFASCVFIFAFLVPLFILFFCYTKLLLHVWNHGKRFRNEAFVAPCNDSPSNHTPVYSNQLTRMMTRRIIKLLKMLLCVSATFVVLWTPYFIIFGMAEAMGMDDTSYSTEWPNVVCRLMSVLSTITNAVLYLAFNDTVRRAVGGFCTRRSSQIANAKYLHRSHIEMAIIRDIELTPVPNVNTYQQELRE